MPEALTVPEVANLVALEAVVERGMATFVEVGLALTSIRDQRLYRATHATFAAYCLERWGVSDRRVRQLMDAADVAEEIGTTVPLSERALRPLAALPDDTRAPAIEAVRNRIAEGMEPRTAVQESVNEAHRAPARASGNGKASAPPVMEPAPLGQGDDGYDFAKEFEFASAEVARLNSVVESLSKSDAGREIVSLNARYAALNGRLQQEITTCNEARRTAKYQTGLLQKIRTALAVEANSDILPAIEALKT